MSRFARILLSALIAAAIVFAVAYRSGYMKQTAAPVPGPTGARLRTVAPEMNRAEPIPAPQGQSIPVPTGEAALPQFPWPPPAPSASYVFPAETFNAGSTMGQVTSRILDALEKSGYVERSFFQTQSGGVALVTRLERISDDGAPAPEAQRWPPGFTSSPSDFAAFLRGLFYAEPGYYRILVFVLQSDAFAPSPGGVSGEAAKAWLTEGANKLPREVAAQPFGSATCTALIYEFASDGTATKMVGSALTGKQHLEKAGLLAVLR
ncbi:MAG: hypothetical protein ACLPPF_03150 [Rhodomicrobium sp.]